MTDKGCRCNNVSWRIRGYLEDDELIHDKASYPVHATCLFRVLASPFQGSIHVSTHSATHAPRRDSQLLRG